MNLFFSGGGVNTIFKMFLNAPNICYIVRKHPVVGIFYHHTIYHDHKGEGD